MSRPIQAMLAGTLVLAGVFGFTRLLPGGGDVPPEPALPVARSVITGAGWFDEPDWTPPPLVRDPFAPVIGSASPPIEPADPGGAPVATPDGAETSPSAPAPDPGPPVTPAASPPPTEPEIDPADAQLVVDPSSLEELLGLEPGTLGVEVGIDPGPLPPPS